MKNERPYNPAITSATYTKEQYEAVMNDLDSHKDLKCAVLGKQAATSIYEGLKARNTEYVKTAYQMDKEFTPYYYGGNAYYSIEMYEAVKEAYDDMNNEGLELIEVRQEVMYRVYHS